MSSGLLASITEPDIGRHLLREEGEVVVDEVRRHWVAYVRPALEAWLALVCWSWARSASTWTRRGCSSCSPLALMAHAAWVFVRERRECFVITNMRVFRLHGVLVYHLATMPLSGSSTSASPSRCIGRILGYGHFVFESAAQEQGLKEIRFVAPADERDLTIQRVVQRSGLRGPRVG